MNPDVLMQIDPAAEDWPLFNAVEVSPVAVVDGIAEVVDECEVGDNPAAQYIWSVYLHYDPSEVICGLGQFGGVICVADCRTKSAAYALAADYEARLSRVIGDHLIPMNEGHA